MGKIPFCIVKTENVCGFNNSSNNSTVVGVFQMTATMSSGSLGYKGLWLLH